MKRFFLFRRLFFALAFFFFVILAIEVVCGDWFGEPTYNINNLIRSHEADLDVSELYDHSSTVRYTRDAYGLRGPYEDLSSIDILTIGGSTTDQRAIGDGETWQDLLHQHLSSEDRNIQIANAGVDGHSSYGHVRSFDWWLANIKGLRAKFVMTYVGVNDLYLSPVTPDLNKLRPSKSLAQRSFLFSLGSRIKKLFVLHTSYHLLKHQRVNFAHKKWTHKGLIEDYDGLIQSRLDAYRIRLEALLERIHNIQAVPIFVTQYVHVYKTLDGILWGHEEQHKYMGHTINGVDVFELISRFNDVTLAVCHDAGAICIDLGGDAVRGLLKLRDEDFYDFVHPTPSGTRKIAEYLGVHLGATVF